MSIVDDDVLMCCLWYDADRRDIFYRMGFVDKEIVALSGGEYSVLPHLPGIR